MTNTFGEHHNYLLAHRNDTPIASGESLEARKAFHVSPFCGVAGRYRFRFTSAAQLARPHRLLRRPLGAAAARDIDLRDARPLNARAALSLLVPLSLVHRGGVVRIHWQALSCG